jgi:hypothetical protein
LFCINEDILYQFTKGDFEMKIQLMFLSCLVLLAFMPVISIAGVWHDDFNGTTLDPGWKFSNATGLCTSKVADGWFSITLKGANDIWGGMDNSARLLRNAPAGDFTLETYIKIVPDPTSKTQNTWTTIIFFNDTKVPSSDWLYVSRGGADEVNIEYVQNNTGNVGSNLKNIANMDLYLKAEKVGQDYTGYYKIKNTDQWTKVGTYKHTTLTPNKVGFCVKSWADRSMVSSYDYFEMTGSSVESNITAVAKNEKLTTTWGLLK